MNLLIISLITETESIPWYIYPIGFIYLVGAILAAKGVNKRKKWWQKIIFVVFWPFYFSAIIIKLIYIFG